MGHSRDLPRDIELSDQREPGMSTPEPLLVTAQLDDESQRYFDELRRMYFPPQRNHLAAHVTLFHHLPGVSRDCIADALERAAGRRRMFAARVSGVASLGRGVAFSIDSPDLLLLRAELAEAWANLLTRQDSRRFWPHITVQNKVTDLEARALLAQLEAAFAPRSVRVEGLRLWRYLGGPWGPVRSYPLAA